MLLAIKMTAVNRAEKEGKGELRRVVVVRDPTFRVAILYFF